MGKAKTNVGAEAEATVEKETVVEPKADKIASAKKHVKFHLNSGQVRVFHAGDHGKGWKSVAKEFSTTHKANISKTEVL